MLPHELLQEVKKLEILVRRLVDTLFGGEYHSVFKGKGMEFFDVRPYVEGDEIRYIDWNVTARMREPYIKRFKEERELTMMLIVDFSGSTLFGSRNMLKRELAAFFCGVIGFAALRNNDKIGLIAFTDDVEHYIPPSKGKTHTLRVIRDLLYTTPRKSGTNIEAALSFLLKTARKKATVFLVTDLLDENFETTLKVVNRRHDLIVVELKDPVELEIPDVGLVELWDPESGITTQVNTANPKVRERYREFYHSKRNNNISFLRSNSIDLISLTVGESLVLPLTKFFHERSRRR